jgi:hypothetical protein
VLSESTRVGDSSTSGEGFQHGTRLRAEPCIYYLDASLSAFWKVSTDEFLVTLVDEALQRCRKEIGEGPELGAFLALQGSC